MQNLWIKAESQNNNEEQLLFKLINQKYTRRTNVNSELQRILKSQFGITGISTHSLRHSYGTRCVESCMAPVVVQRLMGHTDITVTLNTYTSVFNKYKESELEKVNNYYMENELFTSKSILNNIENNIENNMLENGDREYE